MDENNKSDHKIKGSVLGGWIAGILGSVISGILVYHLTVGFEYSKKIEKNTLADNNQPFVVQPSRTETYNPTIPPFIPPTPTP